MTNPTLLRISERAYEKNPRKPLERETANDHRMRVKSELKRNVGYVLIHLNVARNERLIPKCIEPVKTSHVSYAKAKSRSTIRKTQVCRTSHLGRQLSLNSPRLESKLVPSPVMNLDAKTFRNSSLIEVRPIHLPFHPRTAKGLLAESFGRPVLVRFAILNFSFFASFACPLRSWRLKTKPQRSLSTRQSR